MKLYRLIIPILSIAVASASEVAPENGAAAPVQLGIAAKFPGDVGLGKHPSVIMVEDFEVDDVDGLKSRWDYVHNQENGLELDKSMQPEGSVGGRSLRITVRKGKNEGGFINKILKPGYDEVFARMYVRFDERMGFCKHFCKLGGDIDPKPWPLGRAGSKAETWFKTGIEPAGQYSHTWPPVSFAPPGAWLFYTYYPGMHSWQNEDGTTNGKPNPFYGNLFMPKDPALVDRGRWMCAEWSIKLNSAPDKSDGSQRFWIDGRLLNDWSPGSQLGYWMREQFRIRPDQPERCKPFEGFIWRTNMAIQINEFKLECFADKGDFSRTEKYQAEHPDYAVDAEKLTVWFDHVVLAREYIGPMKVGDK